MNGTQNFDSGDSEAVSTWLKARGYSQYIAKFVEREITMKDLARLTEGDLKALGVSKIAHVADLLAKINELNKGGAGAQSPPATVAAMPKGMTAFPGMVNPILIKPVITAPAPASRAYGSATGAVAAAPPPAPAARTGSVPTATAPAKKAVKRRIGGGFLVISIVLHVIFGLVATYFVVQTITHRKLTFKSGPPSPNPNERAMEHKVEMVKKQNTMSAPMAMKRIVTTGMSKVALPAMPDMPAVNPEMPTTMEGMGGPAMGVSATMGMPGAGSSGGGGGPVSFYGFSNRRDDALEGTFYSLKETRDGRPTKYTERQFYSEVAHFIKEGWNMDILDKYKASPNKLYATRIFTPNILSMEGPTSFGMPPMQEPPLWVVHYQGRVSPNESGVYHFVGAADAVIFVKLDGNVVLNGSWTDISNVPSTWKADKYYTFAAHPKGLAKGPGVALSAGQFYDMEVLVGDQGGATWQSLYIEEEGKTYQKDAQQNPILPIFRISPDPLPKEHEMNYAPHAPDGPVWQGKATFSVFK